MQTPERERRRPLGRTASLEVVGDDTPTVSAEALALSDSEVNSIVSGRLVIAVVTKDAAGRTTVRPYVNVRAADRALARARTRGCAAELVLVRQSVDSVGGGV